MKIYNTLTRNIEEFKPSGNVVNMYVCGITPYSQSHLGHAMCAIVFDVIRRYLEFSGYEVNYIQNFTDIDDKMIIAANKEGIEVSALAERNIEIYLDELDKLNVKKATRYPRATEEIESIISLISELIIKDFAYELNGDVYFRVKNDADYGKLSRRNIDQMIAGARLDIDEDKEYSGDFALWKSRKPAEPFWNSPWGEGRPGWHIECSAMALKYLGQDIDIHGGGLDLIFPHHENEIAQSESATGIVPFAQFWIHNGTLGNGIDKMSKSIGNVFTIQSALKKYSSDTLRMFFLASHYRSPLIFNEEIVSSQNRALDRLRTAYNAKSGIGTDMNSTTYIERFVDAMNEDINTPIALSVLFDLAKNINKGATENLNISHAQNTLLELASILGLKLEHETSSHSNLEANPFIELLIQLRKEFRSNKNYDKSDYVRDQLLELGVTLEDDGADTSWNWDSSR
jgi:cysteinyl-tRNA synthetase